MKQVVILAFDGALASAITGIVDLFSMAGTSWNRIQNQQIERLFEVKIASPKGQSIQCINGIKMHAELSYQEIQYADLVVVPTIGAALLSVLQRTPELIIFLQYAQQQHFMIAANCTGNFFLAEAGILNGKQATTHWGFEAIFKQRYPQVELKVERMITHADHIYCAGGGLAWFDLGLHLTERFYGFEVAIQTAKSFVIDYRRDSQLSYSLMKIAKPHQDALVQEVQNWMEQHYSQNFNLDEIAQHFNLSTRSLIRRFKAALDLAPNQYLQAMRIEAARKQLEQTDYTVEQIMLAVGYNDSSSFRRLFLKKTGLTPLDYRRRFSRHF